MWIYIHNIYIMYIYIDIDIYIYIYIALSVVPDLIMVNSDLKKLFYC